MWLLGAGFMYHSWFLIGLASKTVDPKSSFAMSQYVVNFVKIIYNIYIRLKFQVKGEGLQIWSS